MIWEQQEKEMLVSDDSSTWVPRFVVCTKGDMALSIFLGEEEDYKSGIKFNVLPWKFHKPLPEKSALETEIEATKEQLKRLQERLEAER